MGMRLARLRASDHPLGRQKVHFAFISVSHSVGEWPLFAQSESARSSKAGRSTRAHEGAGCGFVADGCVGIVGLKIGEWFLSRFNFLLGLTVNAASRAILLSLLLRSVGASGWGAGR